MTKATLRLYPQSGDGSRILFWHDKWVGLKRLYPQLYVCSNDKEACISDVLCYQEGGSDRIWNLRFYRNFHERELGAASLSLSSFNLGSLGVVGMTLLICVSMGMASLIPGLITISLGVQLPPIFRGRVFGKLRSLGGGIFCVDSGLWANPYIG